MDKNDKHHNDKNLHKKKANEQAKKPVAAPAGTPVNVSVANSGHKPKKTY